MARELAPAGLRSRPKNLTGSDIFRSDSPSSGSKLPRHKKRPRLRQANSDLDTMPRQKLHERLFIQHFDPQLIGLGQFRAGAGAGDDDVGFGRD